MAAKGYRVSFWGAESLVNLYCDGGTTVKHEKLLNGILSMLNGMV